jgi:hypothetical protein
MDEDPELAEYESSDERPLRSARSRTILRLVVIVGVLCLILPEIVTSLNVASATAQSSCAAWVANQIPEPTQSEARFEVFGPGFIGWECYAVGGIDGERHIASLGLIPGPPDLPPPGTKNS